MIELIPGVTKEDYSDYVLYFIESLTEELKQEIRNRLVSSLSWRRSSSIRKKDLFLQGYGKRVY